MIRVVSLDGRVIQIVIQRGMLNRDPGPDGDDAQEVSRLSELTFFVIAPEPD